MSTFQLDVRWRPEGTKASRAYDKSFSGQPDAVIQEALDHIERNYLTLTTIKHPDSAESTRFWNFALSEIEAALNQVARNVSTRDFVCIGVNIGYHSIQIKPAEEMLHPAKPRSSVMSLLIRVPAHPLVRAPRQVQGACALV